MTVDSATGIVVVSVGDDSRQRPGALVRPGGDDQARAVGGAPLKDRWWVGEKASRSHSRTPFIGGRAL